MIKGFFFDLDGTLVDTHRANFEAYRRALADIGVLVTWEMFEKSIGHQAKVFLRWFAPDLSDEEYSHIGEQKSEYYKKLIHLSKLNSRLIHFVDAMRPNHSIVLVTSAKHKNALEVLKYHNIVEVFDHIITAEDVENPKPSPEGYRMGLLKTKLSASEVIAFEDSDTGIRAAESAGIAVVQIKDFSI